MTTRLAVIAVAFSASVFVAASGVSIGGSGTGLIVHEWGTFTSIAGEDGRAVQWLPQSGPADLPDFVGRIDCRLKGLLPGTVRMETPVIYFYSSRDMTVNVSVRFRQGVITEWFPRPAGGSDATSNDALQGDIGWSDVKVMPGARAQFPVEARPNHYFVARETDAAPLSVGSERERFLFYRGVGRLPPPIAASMTPDGQIVVRQTRGEALGDIILFENRDGAMAYRAWHTSAARIAFNPLELEGEGASPQAQLQKVLVARGLYPREAKAMVESWRGSWFEQGTRLFYIVSNEAVDAILPLQVQPRPDQVARVFVGRLEIATPATLREVKDALVRNDAGALKRYGRFLQPIGQRVLSAFPDGQRAMMERRLQLASASYTPASTSCR